MIPIVLCSVLFISDTHGPAAANEALVREMLTEDGIDAVLHAGDVADASDLYGPWFDEPFRDAIARWPWYVSSGNHDETDDGTKAAFDERFPSLPAKFSCGPAEVYLLPWSTTADDIAWLSWQVAFSEAKWRVLLVHRPVWPIDGGNAATRAELEPILPWIDLVLAGHGHIGSDSVHVVGRASVRQIVVVSGPKKYAPGPSSFWRLGFSEDGIEATSVIVPPTGEAEGRPSPESSTP